MKLTLAWALLICAPSGAAAAAVPRYAPGALIVKFRDAAAPLVRRRAAELPGLRALNDRLGLKDMRRAITALDAASVADRAGYRLFLSGARKPRRTGARADLSAAPDLQDIYRLRFFREDLDMEAVARQYAADPNVEYAHPDYLLKVAAAPNDPQYAQQWAHQIMHSQAAWDVATGGAGVVVAVVDTGVDWNHPDLAVNIWSNAAEVPGNGLDDDGNGYVDDVRGWDFVDSSEAQPFAAGEDIGPPDNDPMDFYGHGTLVAGTIAAAGDNGAGIAGVCWTCKIMPLRVGVAERDTGNAYILTSWVANAVHYAALNGADVINLSLTDAGWPDELTEAIDLAYAMDAVIVGAAGNRGESAPVYPAAYAKVLGVAASDQSDQRAVWGSPQPPLFQGASSNYGTWVKVAAPGSAILSTAFDDAYASRDGTSFAAAYASGLAALLRARSPGLKNSEVMRILESTADRVSSDKYIGLGRINAQRALLMTAVSTAQITSPDMEQTLASDVDVRGSASGDAFASYALRYGEGLYPASWTDIASGNSPVVDGTLGSWDVSSLADNRAYTLRLTVLDAAGNATVAERLVYVQKDVQPGWPKTLSGAVAGDGLAVGDLDNDGSQEIVAFAQPAGGGPEALYAFKADGTPVLGWPAAGLYDDNGARGSPTLAALTGDGRLNVIASGYSFNLGSFDYTTTFTVLDGHGAALPGWPRVVTSTDGFLCATPAVGDLDGDGAPEIVFASKKDGEGTTAKIFVFRADGTPMPGWPRAFDLQFPPLTFSAQDAASHPTLADLDGDGKLEIVVGLGFDANSRVYAFRYDGTIMPGWPVVMPDEYTLHPIAADLDGDGSIEIVGTTESGRIHVLSAAGAPRAGWPVTPGGAGASPPVVGDLDRDGDLEIVVHTNADKVYAYRADGTALPGWPVSVQALAGNARWPSALIADVDGGDPEVIQASADEALLYAWHRDGTPAAGWPRALPQPAAAAPAIGDLLGNGRMQMAFAYADTLNLLEIGAAAPRAALVWPMAWYDQRHTGGFSSDATAPLVSIDAPASDPVAGLLAVSGTSYDAARVARVELAVDGGAFSVASGTNPWTFNLNTLALANGAHTLRARALDAAGNSGSATRQITVANAGADALKPSVSILSPAADSAISGPVTASVSGSDNVAVTRVELYGDGMRVASVTVSPPAASFTVALSWRPPTGGAHTLRAKAYDAAGNAGSSAPVGVRASQGSMVSLVRSSGGGEIAAVGDQDAAKPRALMLTVRPGQTQLLRFDDAVQQVSVIDWRGRVYKSASKGGGAIQLTLQDEGEAGLPLSSGVWVIQMRDASGGVTVRPLIVVK